MPTIEIEVSTKTKRKIDVEFPFYYNNWDSFDGGGSYDTAARIDEDGTIYMITKRMNWRDTIEWEISTRKLSRHDYGGYISAEGAPRLHAKLRFQELFAELQQFYSPFDKAAA